ncbi:MAG: alanine--tRNA ligase [Bacteroidales bacterium]|nr:alanine--tRNA ligase [Bacteroidales bacterium]
MEVNKIRQAFIDFFKTKEHVFVPSAPIVVKNDPTLMFTNAGMNQFKDIFLGNKPAQYLRVVNSQKCLRVSGKHNDLEEVGHDTYHHTMFEMLGNWSFADYFKKEAIEWAWEFLTEVLKIDKSRLYVTVFEGSTDDGLEPDEEAFQLWKRLINEEHIIKGSKKDNFWEMGDTGPCGPCSEIHVDIRNDQQRLSVPGYLLVNKGDPQVIEIWNLVFIQFNRLANGKLEPLSGKHVDTGMGLERLAMVLQGKTSNYDTDIFQPIIKRIEELSGIKYGTDAKSDVAMRVMADHIRAIAFTIADGQLPSNTGAGYVIRRILRRAVRYAYSYLEFKEPVLFKLVEVLVKQMGDYFNEIKQQQTFIEKVIYEEESSFLRTLETGIKRFEYYIEKEKPQIVDGKFAFELYDTYGFPLDLTQLMAQEHNLKVDIPTFEQCLNEQKERSKKDAHIEASDWEIIYQCDEVKFLGYDYLSVPAKIVRYRQVEQKGKKYVQLVLNQTPFYAESGGQVGDTGWLLSEEEKIAIINTVKENDLIIHVASALPKNLRNEFTAAVDIEKRKMTERNHSATHLLHYALRKVLGVHVEQRGSLVHPEYLRFDFSHPQKLTDEEIREVEFVVNEMIWNAIPLVEKRETPLEEAKAMGAMALFGEKYEDKVRVVRFGESVELCGGTHVENSANIGVFKIVSESAIAAGIRRIEAITHKRAWEFIEQHLYELKSAKSLFPNTKNLSKSIESTLDQVKIYQKKYEELLKEKLQLIKEHLKQQQYAMGDYKIIASKIDVDTSDALRDLVFQLKNQDKYTAVLLAAEVNDKAYLALGFSDAVVNEKKLHAAEIIKQLAKEINGGGGGQAFFATAGGSNLQGIQKALKKLDSLLLS